jgi:hypothetical protein
MILGLRVSTTDSERRIDAVLLHKKKEETMKRTMVCAFVLALAGSVIGAPSTILAQGTPQPPPGRFQPLPASPEPPEMQTQRQQMEQVLQGINQGQLSPQQKRQMLLNHSNQNIRAKAQQAARRAPGILRPASPEPPEMQTQRKRAEQALQGINQGQLSPQQKREMLLNNPNPRIREKAQEAQRAKIQPRGSLDAPKAVASLSSLWAALNPFGATDAQAQSRNFSPVSAGFAVTLTPQKPFVGPHPYAILNLYGATVAYGGSLTSLLYGLSNVQDSCLGCVVQRSQAIVQVHIPVAGWYVIDFYGFGKPKATLRKFAGVGQYPVLESWDMTTSPIFLNHFATAEYLAQGSHLFYFIVETPDLFFYGVSIEAF